MWISLRNKEHDTRHLQKQMVLWLVQVTDNSDYLKLYLTGAISLQDIVQIISENISEDSLLIVDDLPDPVEFESVYLDLQIITTTLIQNQVRVITSSQRDLPPSIQNSIASKITIRSCLPFTAKDIESLFIQAGAPVRFQKAECVNDLRQLISKFSVD